MKHPNPMTDKKKAIIWHRWQGGVAMKKSRYTDSRILVMLKQNEAGISVAGLCRERGMSGGIFTCSKISNML